MGVVRGTQVRRWVRGLNGLLEVGVREGKVSRMTQASPPALWGWDIQLC